MSTQHIHELLSSSKIRAAGDWEGDFVQDQNRGGPVSSTKHQFSSLKIKYALLSFIQYFHSITDYILYYYYIRLPFSSVYWATSF